MIEPNGQRAQQPDQVPAPLSGATQASTEQGVVATNGAITEESLHQMALAMAAALAELDCPEGCGPVHQFIEVGATIHHEELEWACVVYAVRHCEGSKR